MPDCPELKSLVRAATRRAVHSPCSEEPASRPARTTSGTGCVDRRWSDRRYRLAQCHRGTQRCSCRGQESFDNRLVALSILTCMMPAGAVKSCVSEYCGSFTARFMNSAQMGAAATVPVKLDVGVVVVAHPHNADQVAGEACEPRVVAGARLARRGSVESAPPHFETCPRS